MLHCVPTTHQIIFCHHTFDPFYPFYCPIPFPLLTTLLLSVSVSFSLLIFLVCSFIAVSLYSICAWNNMVLSHIWSPGLPLTRIRVRGLARLSLFLMSLSNFPSSECPFCFGYKSLPVLAIFRVDSLSPNVIVLTPVLMVLNKIFFTILTSAHILFL